MPVLSYLSYTLRLTGPKDCAACSMRRLHERKAADEQYRDRSLRYEVDDDGCFVIKGRFPAEQGAMILKALELAMHRAEAEDSEVEVTAETSMQ